MLPPTTARGLLGNFPQGSDPPANDRCATTPPVQSPTSLSLRAISVAGAGGRGARGGVSGRKGTREEGRRSAGEGGRTGDATGRTRGETEMGRRTMTAQRRTTADMGSRRRG